MGGPAMSRSKPLLAFGLGVTMTASLFVLLGQIDDLESPPDVPRPSPVYVTSWEGEVDGRRKHHVEVWRWDPFASPPLEHRFTASRNIASDTGARANPTGPLDARARESL